MATRAKTSTGGVSLTAILIAAILVAGNVNACDGPDTVNMTSGTTPDTASSSVTDAATNAVDEASQKVTEAAERVADVVQDKATEKPAPEPAADPASITAELTDKFAAAGVLHDGFTAHDSTTALTALEALTISPESPQTGYDRDAFKHWTDTDKDGCDTRQEMLTRDLNPATVVYKDTPKNCKVAEGAMRYEPYTGRLDRRFVAGSNNLDLQLDAEHLVALAETWGSGAWAWDAARRETYANDPLVVIMADASQNRSHGDNDAAEWLPANQAFHREYCARTVTIKAKYELTVDQREHDALATCLGGAK